MIYDAYDLCQDENTQVIPTASLRLTPKGVVHFESQIFRKKKKRDIIEKYGKFSEELPY